MGLLCKKKQKPKQQLRIQKSINSDGTLIDHEDFILAKKVLPNTTQLGKDKKSCHYDFRTHTCRCGITLDYLKMGSNCPIKQKN